MNSLHQLLSSEGLAELGALATRARGQACPRLSKYSVGAAVLVKGRGMYAGANVEYGSGYGLADSRGIHAEEVAVANAIMACGNDIEIQAVAVRAGGTPLCCGNCLDVLRSYSKKETLVVAIGDDGERTTVELGHLLPDEFRERPMSQDAEELIREAIRASANSNHRYSSPVERSMGAAVMTAAGNVYLGAREDSAAFHPVSAIENALGASRTAGDTHVRAVAFVSGSGKLSGRERQKLIERGLEIGGLEFDVYMHSLDSGRTQVASCAELLPYAFTGDGL